MRNIATKMEAFGHYVCSEQCFFERIEIMEKEITIGRLVEAKCILANEASALENNLHGKTLNRKESYHFNRFLHVLKRSMTACDSLLLQVIGVTKKEEKKEEMVKEEEEEMKDEEDQEEEKKEVKGRWWRKIVRHLF